MTVPAAGMTSSMSTLVSVVLPAPFRPTSPIRSPALMWNVTSDKSVREPTTTDSCCAEIIYLLPHGLLVLPGSSHCREVGLGARFCSPVQLIHGCHARFDKACEFFVWGDSAFLGALHNLIGKLFVQWRVHRDLGLRCRRGGGQWLFRAVIKIESRTGFHGLTCLEGFGCCICSSVGGLVEGMSCVPFDPLEGDIATGGFGFGHELV